jgi:hypothetical protein
MTGLLKIAIPERQTVELLLLVLLSVLALLQRPSRNIESESIKWYDKWYTTV